MQKFGLVQETHPDRVPLTWVVSLVGATWVVSGGKGRGWGGDHLVIQFLQIAPSPFSGKSHSQAGPATVPQDSIAVFLQSVIQVPE